MSSFEQRIIMVDNGMFQQLIKTMNVSDICEDCSHFNSQKANSYKCAVMPSCIGITLSEQTKQYITSRV